MPTKINNLRPGLIGHADMIVEDRHTAISMGSGRMSVLATPALIALMEAAAQNAVDRWLIEGEMSVGVQIAVQHEGATPVGMRVVARAEITDVAGRSLNFRVVASDEKEVIGEGVHRRTVSREASFNRLLQQKLRR